MQGSFLNILYISVFLLSPWYPSSLHLEDENVEAIENFRNVSKDIQLVNRRHKIPSRYFQDVISSSAALDHAGVLKPFV